MLTPTTVYIAVKCRYGWTVEARRLGTEDEYGLACPERGECRSYDEALLACQARQRWERKAR